MTRRVALSGCSGGGKSTLLAEMAVRGWGTMPEPGRRIIRAGGPVPLEDPQGFAQAALEMALKDAAAAEGVTLFDRSALDALCWFDRTQTALSPDIRARICALYDETVYLAPPWPEIFEQDAERQHGLAAAVEEYEALCHFLPRYGHRIVAIPKVGVARRADWLEAQLGQ